MTKNKTIRKSFSYASKALDQKKSDLQKEVKDAIRNLLEKTYKQFEKT
jgi:N12 class adenine-specific DNA methylase